MQPDNTKPQDAFERFINDNITPDDLAHIVKTFDLASEPSTTGITLHVNMVELKARLSNINVDMRLKIEQSMREQFKAMYEGRQLPYVRMGDLRASLKADDMQQYSVDARKERFALMYGDDFVLEATTFAQTQGMSFEQAVDMLVMRNKINTSMEALQQTWLQIKAFWQSEEMQEAIKGLGVAMSQFQRNALTDQPFNSNRHVRRAAKHPKQLKDADQSWKNRDYRNRR